MQGDLRKILVEPSEEQSKWKVKLSPADLGPVRESEKRGMGYIDKKYVLMGKESDGWQGLQLNNATTGPIVVCEPNTGTHVG